MLWKVEHWKSFITSGCSLVSEYKYMHYPAAKWSVINHVCIFQATSKLLISYPEPQRSHILDYLFKVNAILHVFKKKDNWIWEFIEKEKKKTICKQDFSEISGALYEMGGKHKLRKCYPRVFFYVPT